jgi:flavin reductase (DIM6/NTAB) family NADH-FMN oxidoreductase RutF
MADNPFDTIMAAMDPPLVVVTTAADGERAGCLVGFHTQSSIDPQRFCLWLSKANHTCRVGIRATHFAVHFLATDDLDLAERFGSLTSDRTDKFAGLSLTTAIGGVPVLAGFPRYLIAERVALLDEGSDHVCISTAPVTTQLDGARFSPLRLSAAAHLEPGHSN